MSKTAKAGAVILHLILAAILVAAIVDSELRLSGIVVVVVACIIWGRTRE